MESQMSQTMIDQLIGGIEPPSEEWREKARRRLDTLTKPLGSLGRLEDVAAQFVAIRRERSGDPIRKAAYVFAADHGVAEEGVSAYPREVTRQMVLNFLSDGAAINVLARLHGAALHVVDVGVDADFGSLPGLLHHKVRGGTRNMLREAAMSEDEVEKALRIGYQLGSEAAATGHAMVAIGEMGIGNTTAASAVTCALTGAAAKVATGVALGLSQQRMNARCALSRQRLLDTAALRRPCIPLRSCAVSADWKSRRWQALCWPVRDTASSWLSTALSRQRLRHLRSELKPRYWAI